MCGDCCRGFNEGEVYLYKDDILRLAKHLKLSGMAGLREFVKKYAKVIKDSFFWKPSEAQRGKTYRFKTLGFRFTGDDEHCHFLKDKRILNNHKENLNKAKKVLVLACGNGVQTVAEIIEDAKVIPGLDTLFLGEIKRINKFEKRCNLCGDCIQNLFDGLCPISRCPKNMLNGPCGGSIKGKCEVSKDLDCIWEIIIKKLDKEKKLFLLKRIVEPKNWSRSLIMQR